MVTNSAEDMARRPSMKAGRVTEALIAQIKKAYADKSFDVALQLSEQVLAIDPDNFVALRCQARIFSQHGESDRAETNWRRIIDTAGDKTEAAIALARIAYGRGEWESMAHFADLAVAVPNEQPDALRLAVQARIRAKQGAQLPQLLSRLYRRDPERGMTFLRGMGTPDLVQAQAATLALLKDISGADRALQVFVRACRDAWKAGAVRATSKQEDETTASFLRAIWEYDPDGQAQVIERLLELSRSRTRYLRMAIKKGDRTEILQHAESLVQFNPTCFEAWFAIGRITASDEPERAAACFHACATLKPDDGHLKYLEGKALARSGRLAEAIEAFNEAEGRISDPSDPVFEATVAEVARLGPKAIRLAINQARGGQLTSARSLYAAAKSAGLSLAPDRQSLTAGDRAAFHSWVLISTAKKNMRSLLEASTSRFARVRRRLNRLRSRIVPRSSAAAPS